jgi:hypothetical protein
VCNALLSSQALRCSCAAPALRLAAYACCAHEFVDGQASGVAMMTNSNPQLDRQLQRIFSLEMFGRKM